MCNLNDSGKFPLGKKEIATNTACILLIKRKEKKTKCHMDTHNK